MKEPPSEGGTFENAITIHAGMSLKEVERLLIEATLQHTGGNIGQTARILGLDRSTLYAKIKDHNLSR